jgi:hypothetical protein
MEKPRLKRVYNALAAQEKAEDRACVLKEAHAKAASKAAGKLKKAQAKAAASKAEVQSMFAGGQDGLRLSRKGEAQANALFAEAKWLVIHIIIKRSTQMRQALQQEEPAIKHTKRALSQQAIS